MVTIAVIDLGVVFLQNLDKDQVYELGVCRLHAGYTDPLLQKIIIIIISMLYSLFCDADV